MSHNNDVQTDVIIPGNEKNDKIFLMVYKGLKTCIVTWYRYMTVIKLSSDW